MTDRTTKPIPVDTIDAATESITDEEWARAREAHEHHLELVRADPEAAEAFDVSTALIERRQATLARIRRARQLTQETVGDLLGMTQSEVSKLERRSDMLLSTLRRFIEATGGELHIFAQYPDSAGPIELHVLLPPEPGEHRAAHDSEDDGPSKVPAS